MRSEFELASKIYELEQQLQAAQQNHTSSENDASFLEESVEKNQQLFENGACRTRIRTCE
jgi:hypothetical protein